MARVAALGYAVSCVLVFAGAALYTAAFLNDVALPQTVNHGPEAALPVAISINVALLIVFGLQHSGMARAGFKRWWIRVVPARVERSTYVLFSSLALLLVCALWRPLPLVLWDVRGTALALLLRIVGAAGALVILVAAVQIDAWSLLGLRQAAGASGDLPLQAPGLYRFVRHPLMLGVVLVLWTPALLTAGYLLFAAGMSAYILVGVHLEERDLLAQHGAAYADYCRRVPRLVPRWRG